MTCRIFGASGGLTGATARKVRDYLSELPGRGLAASSQARRLSALRQFFRFQVAEGLRRDDPTATAERPKPRRHLPKVLTVADVEKLLDAAREQTSASELTPARRLAALRVVALIELLYATGLRVRERSVLPDSAGVAGGPLIAVKGKGGRERLVPLNILPTPRSTLFAKRAPHSATRRQVVVSSDSKAGHLTAGSSPLSRAT